MKNISSNNYWDSKAWWCKPWTIISFGLIILISVWEIFHNLIVISLIGCVICLWWILFLIIAPNFYEKSMQQKNPLEDLLEEED
tara:strand:- start:217 stop:468 length:252 start_codon:yes stop_codon:yes gene_type:complete